MECSPVSQQAVVRPLFGVMSWLDGERRAPVWCPRSVSYGWNRQPQLLVGQKSPNSLQISEEWSLGGPEGIADSPCSTGRVG